MPGGVFEDGKAVEDTAAREVEHFVANARQPEGDWGPEAPRDRPVSVRQGVVGIHYSGETHLYRGRPDGSHQDLARNDAEVGG